MAERLDSLISPQVLAQFDQLAAKIDQCVLNFEKLAAEGVRLNSSLGATTGIKNVNTAFNEIGSNEKQMVANTNALIAAEEKLTAALRQRIQVEQQLAAAQKTRSGGTVIAANQKAEVEAIHSAQQWAAQQRVTTAENKKYIQTLEERSRATVKNNVLEAQKQLLAKQDAAALKLQARENLAIKGSLEQRQAALIRLTAAYSQLSVAERQSGYGQRLQSVIQGLNTQVVTLEKSVGKSQRLVGSYGNAITRSLSGAFSMLRNIAYILPGIGIAGILGFLVEPIANLLSKLFTAKDAISDMNKAMEEAKDSFASATANVNKLRIDIDLAKNGFIDKKAVLAEYNDTIGKTTGHVNTLKEAEEALNKNADAYIRYTFLKAAATVALGKAGQLAVDAEIENQKALQGIARTATDEEKKRDKAAGTDGLSEFNKKTLEQERRRQEQVNKKRVDQLNKIGEKFEKDAAEIAKKFQFNWDDGKNLDKTKIKASQEKFFADTVKTEIDGLKKIAEGEQFHYDDRLKKRTIAYKLERDLIEQQKQFEINSEREKLRAITSDPTTSPNARINAENEYSTRVKEINRKTAKELSDIKKDYDGDLLTMQAQVNKQLYDEQADFNEQFKKQTEGQEKALLDAQESAAQKRLDKRLDRLSAGRDAEIAALEKDKTAALASASSETQRLRIEEDFQTRRLQLELDTNKYILLATLDFQKEMLKLVKDPAAIAAIEAKIADLNKKIAELGNQKVTLNTKPAKDALKNLLDDMGKISGYANEVFGIVGGAINASITEEKNRLQEQADLIDRNAAKEIEAINATAETEEKKAARIQIVQAKQQAQREAIDRRQRQIEVRAAEFNKAQSIASIIMETAIAVVRALGAKPWSPTNIALASFIGALGAAQLAVAVATPIPRFATGTLDAPGGKALVGDAWKSELVVTPEGRLTKTPAVPTVMNIPKHSIVFPDAQKAMEAGIGRNSINNIISFNDKAIIAALRDEMRLTRKTISNKKEVHLRPTKNGWERIVKNGDSITKYLNDNLQF